MERNLFKRWLNRKKSSTIKSQKEIKNASNFSKKIINGLNKRDLFIIPSMLYWAEGTKKDFSLSNTDPDLIRTFILCIRRVFNIKNRDIMISIRLYEDLDARKCIKFWSDVTNIDLRGKVKINILKGSKKGKLEYGMCRVRVKKGGYLLKQIKAIYNRNNQLLGPRSSTDRTRDS